MTEIIYALGLNKAHKALGCTPPFARSVTLRPPLPRPQCRALGGKQRLVLHFRRPALPVTAVALGQLRTQDFDCLPFSNATLSQLKPRLPGEQRSEAKPTGLGFTGGAISGQQSGEQRAGKRGKQIPSWPKLHTKQLDPWPVDISKLGLVGTVWRVVNFTSCLTFCLWPLGAARCWEAGCLTLLKRREKPQASAGCD